MNAKPRIILLLPTQAGTGSLPIADNFPDTPQLSRQLTRCLYCSPARVYLGGHWVLLSPELEGATFVDGICPLHLVEAFGDAPTGDDPDM